MRNLLLYPMALLYIAAGVYHFISPGTYMRIMPPYIPYHAALVAISGFCEILCGILLLISATRVIGAWLLIALLIAVFPANIQMMIDYPDVHHARFWILLLRLPLQGVLIWWAWIYTRKSPAKSGSAINQ